MDKLNLMKSFIAVAEEGTYTAAARKLGKTKALLSTHVSQLEQALDVRLITRSTRSLALTDTGRAYYEQTKKLLDELAILESSLKQEHQQLAGRLRLTAPATYGEWVLTPFVSQFIGEHPQLVVEVQLNDRYVDLIGEGLDLAIRIGELADSSLIARQVAEIPIGVYASPEFVRQYGVLQHPDQLAEVPCIVDTNGRNYGKWRFVSGEEVKVQAHAFVNSAMAACKLAVHSAMAVNLPDFAASEAIAKGQLVPVLPDYSIRSLPVHIVYPHRRHLSLKVQTFIEQYLDFVKA